MTSLSNDIKNTVNNLSGNEKIPAEKIQYWKGIVSNLGLNELNGAIEELEKKNQKTKILL